MTTISLRVIATILGLYAAFCFSQPVSTLSGVPVLGKGRNVAREVKNPPGTPPLRANCANAAKVLAGGSVHTRSQEPDTLRPRMAGTRTVMWCAPGRDTRTLVVVDLATTIGGPFISELLTTVANSIDVHLQRFGNGFLTIDPQGVIGWQGRDGFRFRVWNNIGHELTYQVLHSAVLALYDYMSQSHWAEATFDIYDMGVKVGMGFLSR